MWTTTIAGTSTRDRSRSRASALKSQAVKSSQPDFPAPTHPIFRKAPGTSWEHVEEHRLMGVVKRPCCRAAFDRKSGSRVRWRTRSLRCAAAKTKSDFPSSRVIQLSRSSIGSDKQVRPGNSDGRHEPTILSSRSALRGPKSNYPFWVACRFSASREPGPINAGYQLHIMDSDYAPLRRYLVRICMLGRYEGAVMTDGVVGLIIRGILLISRAG
jgi:hypothetical protein